MPSWLRSLLIVIFLSSLFAVRTVAQEESERHHLVYPGDTWLALSVRYEIPLSELVESAGTINTQRQPPIGQTLQLRDSAAQSGYLLRPLSGGLLQTSARFGRSPWTIALRNDMLHPYSPLLYTPIFILEQQEPAGGDKKRGDQTQPRLDANNLAPREFPIGIESLSVSQMTAYPGQALAITARTNTKWDFQISLDKAPWPLARHQKSLVALAATGAFFRTGEPELAVQPSGQPLWTQPWHFEDREWNYDQVTFLVSNATDPEIMRQERERLQAIWAQFTPTPLWQGTFRWPLEEYVELTSHYGARRSINGGPYDTYHEGTDFSAYKGTPVYAAAGGKISLAENLIVRGGTVIIDHGLGIHTGYYHLSKIDVTQGQELRAGEKVGEVGSTGRSTGNHLHWDFLIGQTWVDAESWMQQDIAIWLSRIWAADHTGANNFGYQIQ